MFESLSSLFDGSIFMVIGVILVVLLLFFTGYVKAPTDKAFIISGLRKEPRVIIGRATVKIPFLERKDELTLQLIQIDVKTASTVPTADYINVKVDSNVNLKVGSTPELIKLSSQNFLCKDTNYIATVAREVLEGNIREIVGTMRLEDMVKDRKKFAEAVKDNAEPDLNSMGLELISFNVQNFIDDNKVIENLGIDNIVTIQKNAEIARANSEKEIAQAKSKADKEANDARVTAEQDIAIRNNELALKQSELKIKEDEKKAEADAVYKITEEVQRKRLETTKAEADIEKQEKTIAIREKEALVKERVLEAEIKKQAEADKYKRMQEAEAEAYEKQKEADVKQYKAKKEYEILKDQAEAELIAEQKKAEGISAVGKAEAEAIRAKLLAEAEGLDKKADAMNKMQQAAVIEMVIEKLPDIVKNAAAPLANVDSITMYGEGNGAKMVGDIMTTTDKVIKGLEGAVGLDIKSLITGALGGALIANKSGISEEDAENLAYKLKVELENNIINLDSDEIMDDDDK